jgi:hypothetical protein
VAEEESGTPTSPVLTQTYPSISIEKEVEEDHGLTASRWAPKERAKVEWRPLTSRCTILHPFVPGLECLTSSCSAPVLRMST